MTDPELRTLLEALRRQASDRAAALEATLAQLTRDRSSRAAAALSASGAETTLLEHTEAHAMWVAVAACLRTFPDEQEPTP